MSLKRSLLRWYGRRLWPMTALILLFETVYLLLVREEPFEWHEMRVWLFVFAHCGAISLLMGRYIGEQEMFLFSRGFPRDVLQRHRRIAWSVHALLVWAVAAFLIWSGLRSFVQDRVVESAYYPIFASRDFLFPLAWLAGYPVCGAFWEYAVARSVQPSRGGAAGVFMLIGLGLAGVSLIANGFQSWIAAWLSVGGLAVSTMVLWWSGKRLARTVEVRS